MLRRLLALAAAIALSSTAGFARADLPPPPGQHRVDYSFEIDAAVEGNVVVAFPQYGSGDASNAAVIEPGKAVTPFKGWTPGLFLLPSGDLPSLPKGDPEAAKAFLASKAKVCLTTVPRIYQIAEETKVDGVHDVIHLAAKGSACEATLVTSRYTATDGKKVEGGVDASGQRTAPPPLGKGLPSVREAGFVGLGGDAAPRPTPSTSPSPDAPAPAPSAPARPGSDAPASGGCAGCALASPASGGVGAIGIGLAVAALAARRRAGRAAPP